MLPGILREASILFWLEFFCCCSNQYSRQLLWEGSQLKVETSLPVPIRSRLLDTICAILYAERPETGNIWKLPHGQEKFRLWSKCIVTNPAFLCKIIPVIVGHKKPSPLLQQRGRCKAIACTLKMRLNAKSQQRHSTITLMGLSSGIFADAT